MASYDSIVVGAGLGGLASAIRLAGAGQRVLLLEKNAEPGGKCGFRDWQGFAFDTGPSLLTMPFVLEDLLASVDRRLEDYLHLEQVVDPAYRYFFADGRILDIPGSLEALREVVAREFPHDLAGFDRFLRYAENLWEVSRQLFLFHAFGIKRMLQVSPMLLLQGLRGLVPGSMDRVLRSYFKDPQLLQLMQRFATYNGSDPTRAHHTFNVIAYTEWRYGGWHPRGGMTAIVHALSTVAQEVGVTFLGNRQVRAIKERGPASGTKLEVVVDDAVYAAQQVIINADAVSALCSPMLAGVAGVPEKAQRLRQAESSVSGYVLLLAMDSVNEDLAYHNLFFCDDYRQEFRQIFGEAAALTDPTVYLSIPSKMETTLSPPGKEGWFVLVNAPPLDRFDNWQENYAQHLLERLEKRVPGFARSDVLWQEARSPRFFQQRYGAWQGSLYGLSSNSWRSAFFRVPNQWAQSGIFFVGGSAHPGGGIPLVLSSAQIATEAILRA